MNINSAILLPLPSNFKKSLRSISPSTSTDRSYLINSIDLSAQLTKPEDQKKTGSCQAFAATTFIESLLWKITGEKEEFTADEIYNIYFDAWRDDYYKHPCMPQVDAATRKEYRGDGTWNNIPSYWSSRSAGCYWIINWNITQCEDKYKWSYVYHWIFNYNDPSHRKYHYPDKYSKICAKAKNYLLGNIYSRCNDETYSGDTILNPNTLKSQLSKYGAVSQMSIPGHAVVFGKMTPSEIWVDSSWSTYYYYWIKFNYNNVSPYYTPTSAGGHIFDRCQTAMYYTSNTSKTKKKIKIVDNVIFSEGGSVYGIESDDRFEMNRKITLIAVPKKGYYFKCWDDQFDTGEWHSDVREFDISANIDVTPWFTDNEDDIYKVMHNLYIMSSDNCDIICNGWTGELLSGNVSLTNPLSSQNTVWKYNSVVSLESKPHTGYNFICWNDGNQNNPRIFRLSSDEYAFPIISSI